MQKNKWMGRSFYSLMALCVMTASAQAADLDKVINSQVQTDMAAQQSQQNVDGLSDETTQMLVEYREVLRQTESLKAYNQQLDKLVVSQGDEMNAMALQLENIDTTQRDIVPLMLKMIDSIALFVELDVPFLPEERQQRVVQLQTLMERADVSLAEKYRRILEAYQVETEYGRTLEAYQGELDEGDKQRTVNFLRIGRVNLYYLTLDGLEAGVWRDKAWQKLDDKYRDAISHGLKVAKKQLPPDLLVLPMQTAEVAK